MSPSLIIRNDLIETYLGTYEDDLKEEYSLAEITDSFESWSRQRACDDLMYHMSPKVRLELYLEWNGILGYTQAIWDISQGKLA